MSTTPPSAEWIAEQERLAAAIISAAFEVADRMWKRARRARWRPGRNRRMTTTRRIDISQAQCVAYREALEQIARNQQPGYLGAVTAQRIARAALGPDTACGIPVLGQGRTNFPRRAAAIADDPAFDAAPPADPTNHAHIDRDTLDTIRRELRHAYRAGRPAAIEHALARIDAALADPHHTTSPT